MIIVIDTNVLLVSLPAKSSYRPIFDAFVNSDVSVVITTNIYFEYVEILHDLAKKGIPEFFVNFLQAAENIITTEVYYNWNLITADPDDNKFTDAYLAAGADYLVTNDAHFNEVKKINFPPVNIISADDFLRVLMLL